MCYSFHSCSKISSFNSSKELPFDMEDALLLWINKLCSVLNDNQLKKQKLHAEQLLQNQDKAKRFKFRRDQLQPKIQTEFPVMEDLLKDISDGQNLLGIVLFYQPTVISLEGTTLSFKKLVSVLWNCCFVFYLQCFVSVVFGCLIYIVLHIAWKSALLCVFPSNLSWPGPSSPSCCSR